MSHEFILNFSALQISEINVVAVVSEAADVGTLKFWSLKFATDNLNNILLDQ